MLSTGETAKPGLLQEVLLRSAAGGSCGKRVPSVTPTPKVALLEALEVALPEALKIALLEGRQISSTKGVLSTCKDLSINITNISPSSNVQNPANS
jgi:hypothetical protein